MRKLAATAAVWASAWALMVGLDGRIDPSHMAMLLVLAAAVVSLWLPILMTMAVSLAAVLAFNWSFVPPRGSFTVDLQRHALLLATMLVTSWIIAGLMARLRRQAATERQHAGEAQQLREFGEALRDAAEPLAQATALSQALQQLLGGPVQLLMLKDALPATDEADAALLLGSTNADQWTGLWLSLRQSTPFGPGTGRHEELAEWYLPLRGRRVSRGAALIGLPDRSHATPGLRAQAQSLCDQMGLALERSAIDRAAQRAREAAEAQGLRNALLAAISHDYRTPLATIMSAASSLQQQDDKLSPAQRSRLAATILDETRQLNRMTDNTLQIARLDAPGVVLNLDWESAEEIIGAVLRRVRQRDAGARVKARLEPDLPLLRCDALLLMQMLDNLVDNALKYGGGSAVEIRARREHDRLLIAVRDRGPGVAPAWRERIFEAFQRGGQGHHDQAAQRGAGVGLAACRAIAHAHGGQMRLRARSHGGASFECLLPLTPVPAIEGAVE